MESLSYRLVVSTVPIRFCGIIVGLSVPHLATCDRTIHYLFKIDLGVALKSRRMCYSRVLELSCGPTLPSGSFLNMHLKVSGDATVRCFVILKFLDFLFLLSGPFSGLPESIVPASILHCPRGRAEAGSSP